MTNALSDRVYEIMKREMGDLGKFIVEKQCKDLKVDPQNITEPDLPKIAKALGKVMMAFGGKDKSFAIENEIKRLKLEIKEPEGLVESKPPEDKV